LKGKGENKIEQEDVRRKMYNRKRRESAQWRESHRRMRESYKRKRERLRESVRRSRTGRHRKGRVR
jgi:predicted Holliday junction resolvase-like endonuclease